MSGERQRGWWRAAADWGPFVLLCLLGSTRWLVVDRWPQAGSTLGSTSVGCGAAALIVLLAGMVRRGRSPGKRSVAPTVFTDALGGVLLLAGPAMGLVLLPQGLDSSALMMALALTPVVAGVACVAVGVECESLAGHLWPGLAALTGILLVLPQPSLADPAADLAMVLAPVMTGVGAVLVAGKRASGSEGASEAGGGRFASATVVTALSAAALFLGVFALLRMGWAEARAGFSPAAAVLDGVLAVLAIACVRRLGAMRFSAEFVLVPLVVLVEGLLLMRPAVTLRTEFGLALMLLAGVVLAARRGDSRPAETGMLDLR